MDEKIEIITGEQLWSAIVEARLTESHLSLMNMNWWPTPPWEALIPYARIAGRISGDFKAICPLVEERNWRVNLYGVAIAVLADAKPLIFSLVDQLGQSWVSPQIAAGVAIMLSGVEDDVRSTCLEKLYRIATESSGGDEFKFSMSAYAALHPWGKKQASDFENTPEFLEKWQVGHKWYDLTKMHYERWRGILPYLVAIVESR